MSGDAALGSYPGHGTPQFSVFDLHLHPLTHVALQTGDSGGKSTLSRAMLMGEKQPFLIPSLAVPSTPHVLVQAVCLVSALTPRQA